MIVGTVRNVNCHIYSRSVLQELGIVFVLLVVTKV